MIEVEGRSTLLHAGSGIASCRERVTRSAIHPPGLCGFS